MTPSERLKEIEDGVEIVGADEDMRWLIARVKELEKVLLGFSGRDGYKAVNKVLGIEEVK
jgi:CRISPR/Cas system CSM-associated protein Csm3 (group 7 of RAMP superfamily)